MEENKRNQKKLFVWAVAATVSTSALISAPASGLAKGDAGFKDVVNNEELIAAVKELNKRGVLKGYNDGTFRPDRSLTRAQFSKIVCLIMGLKETEKKVPTFKDVNTTDWHFPYIEALTKADVVKGYGESFKPNHPVSRAQMVKMLSKAFDLKAGTLNTSPFKDVKSSDWFSVYLPELLKWDLIEGATQDTFAPNKPVNRGETAIFMFRMIHFIEQTQKETTLLEVSKNEIHTSKGVYTLNEADKKWLHSSNAEALKGAKLKISTKRDQLIRVEEIELTASRKESNSGVTNGYIIFDGSGGELPGKLIVNGDFILLRNMKIKQDLIVSEGAKHSLRGENIVVLGNTVVADSKNMSVQSAKENMRTTMVDSTLNNLQVERAINLELSCSTEIKSMLFSENVSLLERSCGAPLPNMTIQKKAQNIDIQSDANDISITSPTNLTGKGNAKKVTVSTGGAVAIKPEGTIDRVEITSEKAELHIGEKTIIKELILPGNKTAKDMMKNYQTIKENIKKINGSDNPDLNPPSYGGGGGSAPKVDKSRLVELITEAKGYNGAEYSTVRWETFQNILTSAESTANNKNSTQPQVNTAEEELTSAIENLTKPGLTGQIKLTADTLESGGEITIELRDNDLNVNSDTSDHVKIRINEEEIILVETDPDSGTFKGTHTIKPADVKPFNFVYTDEVQLDGKRRVVSEVLNELSSEKSLTVKEPANGITIENKVIVIPRNVMTEKTVEDFLNLFEVPSTATVTVKDKADGAMMIEDHLVVKAQDETEDNYTIVYRPPALRLNEDGDVYGFLFEDEEEDPEWSQAIQSVETDDSTFTREDLDIGESEIRFKNGPVNSFSFVIKGENYKDVKLRRGGMELPPEMDFNVTPDVDSLSIDWESLGDGYTYEVVLFNTNIDIPPIFSGELNTTSYAFSELEPDKEYWVVVEAFFENDVDPSYQGMREIRTLPIE
ncbi:hypothetical protein JOC78_001368 [Bacillus ectoiniformans]|uniref:S-layer homology domain-containing protein n=1 Tax=Bacillus ectoiniformans TaxID=1494429 RepID=UPI0019578394|nr:S-layer homology domain-containing protein [Bacillus ectoiniformans]MBM7648426.1 hypothetical protein [Bacillus ectoiniformans]